MAASLLDRVRTSGSVPAHVAIIMDGNGRWARKRSLPRPFGHQAGMSSVREAVEGALASGVSVLTLFAFSQENWQRPADEIAALMALLEETMPKVESAWQAATTRDAPPYGDQVRSAEKREAAQYPLTSGQVDTLLEALTHLSHLAGQVQNPGTARTAPEPLPELKIRSRL